MYGGNGVSTFQLPDFRGKAAIMGKTPGETGGSEYPAVAVAFTHYFIDINHKCFDSCWSSRLWTTDYEFCFSGQFK